MKRTSRILTLILALAVIACAIVCVSAMAEDNAPKLGEANLVYSSDLMIAFTIEGGADGEYGLAMVDGEGNVIYADYTAETIGEGENAKDFYTSYGIAMKDYDTVYRFAVVDAEGKIVSEITEYSVKAYAEAKLADTTITPEQKDLYNKLLNYGAAVDAVVNAKTDAE